MKLGKIFVFYGPSSAGKSKIQKSLTSKAFPRIITSTTRAPRKREVADVDYYFMSHDLFQKHLENQDFVEWTSYNGEYYGTLKASIEKILTSPRNAHIVLDLAGVIALKKLFSNSIAIYIGANFESIQRRLLERKSTQEEVDWRLNKAITEELTEAYIQFADLVIWNNDGTELSETLERVKEFIRIN
jgi:guanylate kinase